MKNFKKIALGLVIGALAIGFSAFTNNHSKKIVHHVTTTRAGFTPIADDHIVQNDVGSFTELDSPDQMNCSSAVTTRDCIYSVTTTGAANIPDQPGVGGYSSGDIDTYVGNGWLSGSDSPAVYGL